MAMGLAGGGGGRGGQRRGYRPLADINMTPMIDVMLTLLIIFMVSAPLLSVGVPVDLPEVTAGALSQSEEPAAVTVNGNGNIFLQESPIGLRDLLVRLDAMKKSNPRLAITFRGDRGANYGRVMEVLGAMNEAGFTNISLLTEMPDKKPAKP